MRLRQLPHESYSVRVLATLGIVAALLTVWQFRAWTAQGTSLPEDLAKHIVLPLQRCFTAAGNWVHDTGVAVFGTRSLVEENRKLKEERDRLRDEKLLLVQDALEGRTIRERLGFTTPQAAAGVPARVIGHSAGGEERRVTIRAAGGRKLEVGNIVREARGLVGRVISCDGPTAKVILLTDRENAFAARVVRSGAEGMVYAAADVDAGPTRLKIEKLASHADLREGDEIVTSGLGGVYPAGVPVGVVESVQRATASTSAMTGHIRPYVDFDRLSYVYVVRQEK
jgi:rod shape-determining protein MreC